MYFYFPYPYLFVHKSQQMKRRAPFQDIIPLRNKLASSASNTSLTSLDDPISLLVEDFSLSKYHYRYLGALERDVDSFNRVAGLPIEVVDVLDKLILLACQGKDKSQFLKSQLLRDLIEFLLKIPEGLVPNNIATKISTSDSDSLIRMHLRKLCLENYCALRSIAFFIQIVSFTQPILIPFDSFGMETKICEVISPAPRDEQFKSTITKIFADPEKYFKVSLQK